MDKQALLELVHQKLKAKFGEGVVAEMRYDFPVFILDRSIIHDALRLMKEDPELGFHFLTTMCGLNYPDNKGKELGVMYQLHNMPKNTRIRVKTFFPISDPVVPTATDLWATANWMERQEYDFFGIKFTGHPNLKRILNMDEMNYHPMRKEYPLEDATRDDKDDSMFGR
jgi:NADH-quinone oxidoreductase subunit C